jgi:ADP-ribosylglycohydrolase
MNKSAQHHVPYEEILHAIAMDAHAYLAEPGNISPGKPEHIVHPDTRCGLPIHAYATHESSNRTSRRPRMHENRKINATILRQLFETKAIRLERGAIFDHALAPKGPDFNFDRVEGMLLGAAIGDSLGNTSESRLPLDRQRLHGEIRDYLACDRAGCAKGYPSDDTQLTFWTLEQLIEDNGEFIPEHLARKFAGSGRIYGIGQTMRGFLDAFKSGRPWYECGPHSAGNGALMRIAPMLIPHLRHGGTDIWTDTALSAMMTHNDHASTSSCLAFTAMLWELLDMKTPPPPHWWPERYASIAADLQGRIGYTPRSGCMKYSFDGPLHQFVSEKLAWAHANNLSAMEACEIWHSGAYLLETVPSVLYILMRHGHDPEEALVRAVNDTKDNDTVASIVGAAIGALHGRKSLPSRWIEGLAGRTRGMDDGQVFRLISKARLEFWEK